jgi:hypothetical protein
MLRRCQNGHVFNERRHGTICPYCNIDTADRKSSLTSDPLAELPATYEVARPVCGWIVCVNGPSKGRDYKIRAGKNFIGRADDMDIQILGDNDISQSRYPLAFLSFPSCARIRFQVRLRFLRDVLARPEERGEAPPRRKGQHMPPQSFLRLRVP